MLRCSSAAARALNITFFFLPLARYPNCKAFPLEHVGDGWCDSEARFNAEECGWDDGDCCIKVRSSLDFGLDVLVCSHSSRGH